MQTLKTSLSAISEELLTQNRQMVVDLDKSGNQYKKYIRI